MHDGAGLCSPGRWAPEQRRLPENTVLSELRGLLKQHVVRDLGTDLFARLACGKVKECPFDEIEQLRESVYALFEKQGEEPRKKASEQSSPLEFRLLGAFLKHTGDPERDFPNFASGVRVGVGVRMPRVPAVYPRKRQWRLREQENLDAQLAKWGQGADNDNYASAKEFLDAVEEQLEQSVSKGQAVMLTEAEARRKYGRKLVVASLGAQWKNGAKESGDLVVRLLFDGTHGVPVNSSIRVRDQDKGLAAPDVKCVLRQFASQPGRKFGFKVDVTDAHRLIPVCPEDWHLLACRCERSGHVYVNTTGTFAYW